MTKEHLLKAYTATDNQLAVIQKELDSLNYKKKRLLNELCGIQLKLIIEGYTVDNGALVKLSTDEQKDFLKCNGVYDTEDTENDNTDKRYVGRCSERT